MSTQLSFDFDAPVKVPARRRSQPRSAKPDLVGAGRKRRAEHWAKRNAEEDAEARSYWKVGMVTSMPLWAEVLDSQQKYTMGLPGVVESIEGDLASVRIYAAPEYGCWLENYPIHKKLAVNVPLRELGKYALNAGLMRVVADGLLVTGDAALAVEIRARHRAGMSNFAREREMGMVAA